MIELCYWCGCELAHRYGHIEKGISLGNKRSRVVMHVVTDCLITEPTCKQCLVAALKQTVQQLEEGD